MTTQGYVGCTQWEKNQKLREFKKKIIKWLKLSLKDVYRSLEPTVGGNISIPFYGLFLGTMALVTNPLVWTPLNKMASLSKNRHLLEVSRAIMFTMRVPKYLWSEDVLTTSYLVNRMRTRILKFQTPLQCFCECLPQIRLSLPYPWRALGVFPSINTITLNLIQGQLNVFFLVILQPQRVKMLWPTLLYQNSLQGTLHTKEHLY